MPSTRIYLLDNPYTAITQFTWLGQQGNWETGAKTDGVLGDGAQRYHTRRVVDQDTVCMYMSV